MIKFSSDLILWYKENQRELPWRMTSDPYCIWVSEIILQQTRVIQGLAFYERFVNLFPTVKDLAVASEDVVLKSWQGLGYYSRARNMHFSAKFIVNCLNGVFPDNYNELLKLKGVGTYTASAISSICFNEHRTVVDGNVFRVLTRIFGVYTPINMAKGKKEIEDLAHSLNDGCQSGVFNQALMEFGALVCTPKQAQCAICIFRSTCYAYRNNKVDVLPVKLKKTKVKNRFFTFLFFNGLDNSTIIMRRSAGDIWQGLYQFPLIETDNEKATKELLMLEEFRNIVGDETVVITKEESLIHILSHQKLFIKIITLSMVSLGKIDQLNFIKINMNDLYSYAFPKPLVSYIDENNDQ